MDRLQIHIPKPMLERLREIAEKRDYSVAEIIRVMLQKQLDAEKETPCG